MRARKLTVLGALAGVGLATTTVVAVLGASHAGAPGASHDLAGPTRLVSYQGYRTRVPSSWPVYDLAKDPTRCVRFDQHAVYLGTPGPDQRCPAHAVGRTEALLIQPMSAASGGDAGDGTVHADVPAAHVSVTASYLADRSLVSRMLPAAPSGPARGQDVTPFPTGRRTATVPGPTNVSTPSPSATGTTPAPTTTPAAPSGSATATATDSGTPTATDSAPAGTTPTATPSDTSGAGSTPSPTLDPTPTGSTTPSPSTTPDPTPTPTVPLTSVPNHSTVPIPGPTATLPSWMDYKVPAAVISSASPGFETCTAPSAGAMSAWRDSFHSVGIYIGGPNRACADGNLSKTWVQTVRSYGYTFIPTYVGLQPPCVTRKLAKIDLHEADSQGIAAANDAAAEMARFGLGHGNAVYLDIEDYTVGGTCTAAVLRYATGWTRRLHQLGYTAGVYCNAARGSQDFASAVGSRTYLPPDSLWFARWNETENLDAKPYVPDTLFVHRRLKQFLGGHNETHNGVTINIDSDWLDGAIAYPGNH